MDYLLGFLLFAIAGAALVAWVIVWSTNRAAHGAITDYFRDADYILEQHKPPPSWRRDRWGKPANERSVMQRMDKLVSFFEGSDFTDEAATRDELLRQLRDERQRWRAEPPA